MQFAPVPLPTVPAGLLVEAVAIEPDRVVITARSDVPNASCPACGIAADKVHCHYWRTLADLPWHDRRVVWRLRVRRFRCGRCERRTFAERLPDVAAPKGRRTGRLARAQIAIGLAVGGEPGARLSSRLAMPVSGDTVLRLVRKLPLPPCPAPRVVGVDDWAWRRGRRYGTIVCDLERRRVVDLLPDRSAAPLRAWLERHPGVAVISRDRAGSYAEAARTGAPGAVQVADRWHLLVNASDALHGVLERHQAKLREAARLCAAKGKAPAASSAPPTPARPETEAPSGPGAGRASTPSPACTRKACPSSGSRAGPGWPATRSGAGCGPASTSPTGARPHRACWIATSLSSRSAGAGASAAAPHSGARCGTGGWRAATTSSGAGPSDAARTRGRRNRRWSCRPGACPRAGVRHAS